MSTDTKEYRTRLSLLVLVISIALYSCTKDNTAHKDYCISKSGNTLKINDRYGDWGMGITGKGVYVLFVDSSGTIIGAAVDSNYYHNHKP